MDRTEYQIFPQPVFKRVQFGGVATERAVVHLDRRDRRYARREVDKQTKKA